MSFLLSSQLPPHFPHTADDILPQRENSHHQKRVSSLSSHPADKLIHAHMGDFHFPSRYQLGQTVPAYASDLSPSEIFRNPALSKSSGDLPLHQIFLFTKSKKWNQYFPSYISLTPFLLHPDTSIPLLCSEPNLLQ